MIFRDQFFQTWEQQAGLFLRVFLENYYSVVQKEFNSRSHLLMQEVYFFIFFIP